jgi:UDP-N-acetylmuramate: L-alanyl-gamma-D-glutamyl-meso-diaminopimelate ligase
MVCDEYPDAVEIARRASCKVETYGYGKEADWAGVLEEPPGVAGTLEVSCRGRPLGTFPLPLSGRHNGLNVLGSLGLLAHLGLELGRLKSCIEKFEGVRRRQEIVGEVNGVLLMDDFAHHPTAVRETLAGIRRRYPGRRIVAVFEPRTNTSRRNVFQTDYAEAFSLADIAMCAPVFRPETVAPEERFRPDVWVEDLRRLGRVAHCFDDPGNLERALTETCQSGDVVMFMSSGSFADLFRNLKANLEQIGPR